MASTVLSSTPNKIRARQVGDADIAEVVDLMTRGFGAARTHAFWESVFDCLSKRSVPEGHPRYGYVIESDGKLVGVLIAIYSTVWEDGIAKIRCNVSSWYVDPAFRSYAALLSSQAVKRKAATVLNVSAAPHTHAMHQATGFTMYSTGTMAAIPVLSRAHQGAAVRVLDASSQPNAPFDPHERELMLEHSGYGCTSLWCVTPERAHPFVFRPKRVKSVLPCAQLVYCRSTEDFARFARPIGLYLARRMQFLVLLDANAPVPGLIGKYYPDKMQRFFMGPDRPRLGDLAYTEIAMFGV